MKELKGFLVVLMFVALLAFSGVVVHMQNQIDVLEERLTQHEQAPAVLSDETEIIIENWRYGVQDGPDGYMDGYMDEYEYTAMTLGELREQISEDRMEVLRWLNNLDPVPCIIQTPEALELDDADVSSNSPPLNEELEREPRVPHVRTDEQ